MKRLFQPNEVKQLATELGQEQGMNGVLRAQLSALLVDYLDIVSEETTFTFNSQFLTAVTVTVKGEQIYAGTAHRIDHYKMSDGAEVVDIIGFMSRNEQQGSISGRSFNDELANAYRQGFKQCAQNAGKAALEAPQDAMTSTVLAATYYHDNSNPYLENTND